MKNGEKESEEECRRGKAEELALGKGRREPRKNIRKGR